VIPAADSEGGRLEDPVPLPSDPSFTSWDKDLTGTELKIDML
jgi:hypothetical protein